MIRRWIYIETLSYFYIIFTIPLFHYYYSRENMRPGERRVRGGRSSGDICIYICELVCPDVMKLLHFHFFHYVKRLPRGMALYHFMSGFGVEC